MKASHPHVPLTVYANGSGGLLERLKSTGADVVCGVMACCVCMCVCWWCVVWCDGVVVCGGVWCDGVMVCGGVCAGGVCVLVVCWIAWCV